jgi:pilus assembly protein CpaC
MILKSEFPKAAIRVRPIGKSVLLTGSVNRPEAVTRIVEIAETFYPKVINNVTVGGVHQVTLHVKVMEVSRTKLRAIGFDWGNLSGNGDFVIQSAAGLVANAVSNGGGVAGTGLDTIRFGIVDNNNAFFGFLEALRANNVIKILAEPTLTAVSGRPAYFHEGGEFPILVPSGLGTTGVQYKQFGTRVDFVPIVLGNGNIRLEVRPHVSEVDPTRGVDLEGVTVPGLRDRVVETAVEMRSGQTLAIAGLIQTRTEAENIGLPFLSDLPWAGSLFRRVREDVNEIELLVIVRPELVAPLDPQQVPMQGPGERTTSPSDIDLFARGYLEVPKCCPDARCESPQGYATAPVGVDGQPLSGHVLPGPTMNQPAYTTPIGSGYQETGEGVFQGADPAFIPAPQEYPLTPPTTSAPTAPGSAPSYGAPMAVPATTGPYYPANAAIRYRQVRANVPVTPSNKTNVFGPSGYDELDY